MSKKVYKKISGIPDAGLGLFAGEDIPKGALVAEFIGKKTITSKLTDGWSNVFFSGEKCIQCDKANLASFANDCIIFPKKKRNLLTLMNNDEQLYHSYNNLPPNVEIYQNDKLLRAWLRAICDIKKDEEIFVHYGLPFWIKKESRLKESEKELDEYNGDFIVPSEILKSESFKKYVSTFYPKVIEIEIDDTYDYDIALLKEKDNSGIIFGLDMLVDNNCEKIQL